MIATGDRFGLHTAANTGGISAPERPDGTNGGGGSTVPLQRARTAADAWVGNSWGS